ncbi:MAG: lactate utilization protein [Candidatus Bathyarchaeota archaeon]|nr:lactate utilization protein [Candidatus Bathyarchaeota archaeon]
MSSFQDIRKWYREVTAYRVIDSLRKRGFEAFYTESRSEARDLTLKLIPSDTVTIGVGGSVTVRELGLLEALSEKGYRVIHHWIEGLSRDESRRVRLDEVNAEVFLTSVNALTSDGRLILIDGVGNRVAAASFGPKTVIAIAGFNKLVPDLDYGLWRVKNVAMPMNARRLKLDTPCARLGYCTDCLGVDRGCRVTLIIDMKPSMTEHYYLILVGEDLGF